MDHEQLMEAWRYEERQSFTGWDFSYLDGRMVEEHPPWSYLDRAEALMRQSSAVLDMGTGGGERLLELRAHWPDAVVVTEEYPPNLKLAGDRLGLLGVRVVRASLRRDRGMPFSDGAFDLILNRHSGLNSAEVARILVPGGVFLTQQVHGLWAQDLLAEFGATPQWPEATPATYVPRLEAVGLEIENLDEWQGDLIFYDVGAIVYYLKAVPWLVPGFSVETHTDTLMRLEVRLQQEGPLVYEARKYLIEAEQAGCAS
jgi:SAM-dependent methyltransferase